MLSPTGINIMTMISTLHGEPNKELVICLGQFWMAASQMGSRSVRLLRQVCKGTWASCPMRSRTLSSVAS